MSALLAGLRAAPLTRDDIAAATRVWCACDLHDDGEAQVNEDDLVAGWQAPSFVAERDSLGVGDGDALVAVALLHRRSWARRC